MTHTQRMKVSGLLLLGLLVCALNASAHHGVAAFDVSKTVTVTGTVTGFRFDNPHVLLYFNVKDTDGKVQMWVGELNSRNALERLGWTSHTVKPGDGIT